MFVVSVPMKTIEKNHKTFIDLVILAEYTLLDRTFMIDKAAIDPRNTACLLPFIDMIEVIKNVLSPISEAVIREKD